MLLVRQFAWQNVGRSWTTLANNGAVPRASSHVLGSLEILVLLGKQRAIRSVKPYQYRTRSFKDRTPIGEFGCCDAWMAEQTDFLSLLIYLSVHPSIYLSICLSICLSVYLSICLSVYLSICLSVYLSICLFIYLSVYLSICLSVYLSICLSVYLSICLSVYLSICLSVYLSICLSIYLAS